VEFFYCWLKVLRKIEQTVALKTIFLGRAIQFQRENGSLVDEKRIICTIDRLSQKFYSTAKKCSKLRKMFSILYSQSDCCFFLVKVSKVDVTSTLYQSYRMDNVFALDWPLHYIV
jgi:hypothetical protein